MIFVVLDPNGEPCGAALELTHVPRHIVMHMVRAVASTIVARGHYAKLIDGADSRTVARTLPLLHPGERCHYLTREKR